MYIKINYFLLELFPISMYIWMSHHISELNLPSTTLKICLFSKSHETNSCLYFVLNSSPYFSNLRSVFSHKK